MADGSLLLKGISPAQQVILAELRRAGGSALIDNRKVRASDLLRRSGLIVFVGLSSARLTSKGRTVAAEVVSRPNLARLANVAFRVLLHLHSRLRAAAMASGVIPELAPRSRLRLRVGTALRTFGVIQRASEPDTTVPDLPAWGDEPSPERVAARIERGEGTAEQVDAYARALRNWATSSCSEGAAS